MSNLSDTERQTFSRIADYLIPEGEGMPSASQVGVPDGLLDQVLAARPDLSEALLRALRSVADLSAVEAAKTLNETDPSGFHAVTLAATGGYYMSPIVRKAIGYPGQESRPFDPDKTTEYIDDGKLAMVIKRGSIYRPTP